MEELHAERELMTRSEAKTRQLQRKLPKVKAKREKADCKVMKVEDALGLPFSPNTGCTRRGLTGSATGTGSSFSVEPVTSGTAPCTAGEMRAFPAPGEPAKVSLASLGCDEMGTVSRSYIPVKHNEGHCGCEVEDQGCLTDTCIPLEGPPAVPCCVPVEGDVTCPDERAFWLALCVADNTWRFIGDLLTLQELEDANHRPDEGYSCSIMFGECVGDPTCCKDDPTDPACCKSVGLDAGTSRPRGARAVADYSPSLSAAPRRYAFLRSYDRHVAPQW